MNEKSERFFPQDETNNKKFWIADWEKRIRDGEIEPSMDLVEPKQYESILEKHFQTLDLNNKIFLDVGIGTGNKLTETLKKLGGKVIGVDIAQQPLAIAREKGASPLVGSTFHLPSRDRFFDGVININLVNTSAGNNINSLEKSLAENYRVLKEGGIFIQSHYGYAMREIPVEQQLLIAKQVGFKNIQKIENEILKMLEESIYALAYHATK